MRLPECVCLNEEPRIQFNCYPSLRNYSSTNKNALKQNKIVCLQWFLWIEFIVFSGVCVCLCKDKKTEIKPTKWNVRLNNEKSNTMANRKLSSKLCVCLHNSIVYFVVINCCFSYFISNLCLICFVVWW